MSNERRLRNEAVFLKVCVADPRGWGGEGVGLKNLTVISTVCVHCLSKNQTML